jgi:IclR family transcriptional regulator, KDG regulon repressor
LSNEKFYNRSLERALQILNAFNAEKTVLGLSQISDSLKLPRATVLRLCSTLVKYNFLKQDPANKQYSLGIRLFELGSVIFNTFSLRHAAFHHISELQVNLGKTIFLGIIDNDELLYIDKIDDPKNPITFTSKIGTRRPPYWGMVGPMILAFMPEKEVERILRKFPLKPTARKSITKKEEFYKLLSRIRNQGYIFDEETALDGVSGIAAPVFNLSGKVAGAIGVAFISPSVDFKTIKTIINEILATAKKISAEMGYIERT